MVFNLPKRPLHVNDCFHQCGIERLLLRQLLILGIMPAIQLMRCGIQSLSVGASSVPAVQTF